MDIMGNVRLGTELIPFRFAICITSVVLINKSGGLGGEAPNKLLKGPSGKAGGPFNVA